MTEQQQAHWETTFQARPDMYGREPSAPGRMARARFEAAGLHRVLELGAGQGRDSCYLAASGLRVHALDFSAAGVEALRTRGQVEGLAGLEVSCQDLRHPLPFPEACFDACYAHMLFCMAFTTAELEALMAEVARVLRPGGLCLYTVRHTGDPDFGIGIDHGDDRWEDEGFVVHFFDQALVERLAHGFELLEIVPFEEGALPRRLFRVLMRRHGAGRVS